MPGRRSNDEERLGGDGSLPADEGLDAKLDRAVPSSEAEAFLVGVGGAHGGRVYPLSHNTIFIGRSELADVYVSDPSVSGQHARIINGSHGFEIEDLGSTNGTFVDGQRVSRAPLRSGDPIAVGHVEFKFLLDRRVDATMMVVPAGQPTAMRREGGGGLVLYQPPARQQHGQPGATRVSQSFAPTAARDPEDGLSLEEVIARVAVAYRFLRQHARLIAFFAAFGLVLGWISAFAVPPPGVAVCLIKLQPQIKANPVDAQWNKGAPEEQEARFFASPETAFVQPQLVSSTLQGLTGRVPTEGTLGSYVDRLHLEPEADHTYRAILGERLLESGKPTVDEFLKAHIENYLHDEIGRAIRVFAAQADFLRDQLKSVEADMNRLSDERMQFSQKNSDRLPEEATQMLTSRFDLETRRADLLATVRKLEGDLQAQRTALAAEGPLAANKRVDTQVYRESLADVNKKLTEAYARGLADGHPEVIELKSEKHRLEGLIEQQMNGETTAIDRRSNASYQEMQTRVSLTQGQLAAARSDLADTDRSLAQVKNVAADLPRVQAGVQQLTHMQDATTQLHGQLFEQLKKAELQLNLERVSAESRYEVLSPPRLYKARKLKTFAVRGGAGLFVGLALAFATIAVRKAHELITRALFKLDAGVASSRR